MNPHRTNCMDSQKSPSPVAPSGMARSRPFQAVPGSSRRPLAQTAEVWPSKRSLASLSHFAQPLPPQSASNKNSFVILCLGGAESPADAISPEPSPKVCSRFPSGSPETHPRPRPSSGPAPNLRPALFCPEALELGLYCPSTVGALGSREPVGHVRPNM